MRNEKQIEETARETKPVGGKVQEEDDGTIYMHVEK